MITYQVVEEQGYSDELGWYCTYGIRALEERGEEITRVSDVATDRDWVARLADRCTKGQLSPYQLYDVVSDALDS